MSIFAICLSLTILLILSVIKFDTILLALIIYNFTELPFIYTVYPIPLTFLVSLILVLPSSQAIIRLFVWLWLIAYLVFPFFSSAL